DLLRLDVDLLRLDVDLLRLDVDLLRLDVDLLRLDVDLLFKNALATGSRSYTDKIRTSTSSVTTCAGCKNL
ncbi:MAG: hypothetical protein V7L21_31575, partial [Nostoc sp.]|uniref:hypothetical protein n=1 Tax=Nostoc sp. TaxID=1180 RepID=UPI002FFA5060